MPDKNEVLTGTAVCRSGSLLLPGSRVVAAEFALLRLPDNPLPELFQFLADPNVRRRRRPQGLERLRQASELGAEAAPEFVQRRVRVQALPVPHHLAEEPFSAVEPLPRTRDDVAKVVALRVAVAENLLGAGQRLFFGTELEHRVAGVLHELVRAV